MEERGLVAKRPRPFDRLPDSHRTYDGIWARCPKCGRIKDLRTCQSCVNIMCYNCLVEHQVVCLHVKEVE